MATPPSSCLLYCIICQCDNNIKILPCHHKVCSKCLTSDSCPKCHQLIDSDFESFNMIEIEKEFNCIFQDSSEICMQCLDRSTASWICIDCREKLCDSCLSAHQRVRLTKEHTIQSLSTFNEHHDHINQLKPNESSNKNIVYCKLHTQEYANYYCENCRHVICRNCSTNLHKTHSIKNLSDILQNIQSNSNQLRQQLDCFKKAIIQAENVAESVQRQASLVSSQVHLKIAQIMKTLEERERQLLKEIDQIRCCKIDGLYKQIDHLKAMQQLWSNELSKLDQLSDLNLLNDYSDILENHKVDVELHDDDVILFIPPDNQFIKASQKIGHLTSSAYAPLCYATGEGYRRASKGKTCIFFLQAVDHNGQNKTTGGDTFNLSILYKQSEILPHQIIDRLNGTYMVTYTATAVPENSDDKYEISIKLRGRHIKDSPFTVFIQNSPNYTNISQPKILIGGEGDKDGQLSRPWGICTSRDGYLIVADRSNNRIQIFDCDANFVRSFGKLGNRPGQLDRPAGVACNHFDEIIVADKDNHRIQVFSFNGQLLNGWGEKGSKPGQFNYPWDIDVNSQGIIVVSDTRNRRIQVFSGDGRFINKYGFDTPSPSTSLGGIWRHFDSPRGVAFMPNSGHIVVTEFNNHCLLIVKPDLSSAHIIGQEGSSQGQFLRPQGVAVDHEGNVIVSDSRNHRIQVFNISTGNVVGSWGSFGKEPGQFDRPAGLCVSPNGNVFVIDFGNNRIQAF